ncbi:uncharacterized protein AMSG_01891 [Thecamonas trahens ATCC 50062]|uniref:Uncharacterized protein n=1 Tax=Thecamonas trahens ATCC 50062 TaxID=461836 RepID=A0A0L0DTU7_THETB|nr:hypothetical protein AMSG_01891 [Thecamonas trahens ATCC 50062]KNC55622.1 hypothetical protein AMSG_01891 [Thecamonas trahens ATCC 50062]|eukprot:XP_013761395.1 hypothetical protein AMSG_01891 [Thecamonas trahens ATCC 50062]
MICFDYHRELVAMQTASSVTTDAAPHVFVRLHVAVAPGPLGEHAAILYGAASMAIDQLVGTLPWATIVYSQAEAHVGISNLAMLAAMACAVLGLRALLSVAFLPYMVQVLNAVFRDVDDGVFHRDMLFLTVLSASALAFAYLSTASSAVDGLLVLLAAPGFAMAAVGAGDVDVPHPEIAGTVAGLIVLLLSPTFKAKWSGLVAGHVVACGLVLALKVTDAHIEAASWASFTALGADYTQFHRHAGNVYVHLATVALGMGGALGLVGLVSRSGSAAVIAGLVLVVRYTVEAHAPQVAFLSAVIVVVPFLVVFCLPSRSLAHYMQFWQAAGLVIGAFIVQEAAHRVYGEKTYMDSYLDHDRYPVIATKLLLHHLWLTPFTIISWFLL